MLRGQRDRLLQKYLDPPYGQRAAIRNARNGLAVANGRAVCKLPGGNVPSGEGDRAPDRARAMLNTVLRRTSWVSVGTTNS